MNWSKLKIIEAWKRSQAVDFAFLHSLGRFQSVRNSVFGNLSGRSREERTLKFQLHFVRPRDFINWRSGRSHHFYWLVVRNFGKRSAPMVVWGLPVDYLSTEGVRIDSPGSRIEIIEVTIRTCSQNCTQSL